MEENNQEPGISKYVPLLDEPSASAKLKRIEQNYQTIKSQSLEINNQIEQNNEILGRINRQMSSMNTRLTRASNQARLLAVRAIDEWFTFFVTILIAFIIIFALLLIKDKML